MISGAWASLVTLSGSILSWFHYEKWLTFESCGLFFAFKPRHCRTELSFISVNSFWWWCTSENTWSVELTVICVVQVPYLWWEGFFPHFLLHLLPPVSLVSSSSVSSWLRNGYGPDQSLIHASQLLVGQSVSWFTPSPTEELFYSSRSRFLRLTLHLLPCKVHSDQTAPYVCAATQNKPQIRVFILYFCFVMMLNYYYYYYYEWQ